jgi:GNAT superfamily N-acetyltransferase
MQQNFPFFLQPELLCRPALPMDTPGVLVMSSLIWDGEDYLHLVWQDWLSDPEGVLLVGEFGGQIVSTAKLTRLGKLSWWLEGMRVHPEFEGKGFATHVFESILDACGRLGGGMARLVTGSKRIAVHRMCARLGFVKIGDISAYRAPTSTNDTSPWPFAPVTADEASEAAEFAKNSTSTKITGPFMDMGWQWQEPDAVGLMKNEDGAQVYWWHNKEGLLATWMDEENDEKTFSLKLAACPAEDLSALLMDFRRVGGKHGVPEVRAMLPINTDIGKVLEEAGFHRTWDKSLFIYEKYVPVV